MRVGLAIDPGLRECGCALVDLQTSAIVAAWLSKNTEKEEKGAIAWERMALAVAGDLAAHLRELGVDQVRIAVIERQWIAFRQKSARNAIGGTQNPSQILNLAHVVGAVLFAIPAQEKVAILPSQWKGGSTKGGAKKERNNAGVWNALKPAEKARAKEAETYKGHNVKDSIGIAKWLATRYRAQAAFTFPADAGEAED